jgi:hypothetical protein
MSLSIAKRTIALMLVLTMLLSTAAMVRAESVAKPEWTVGQEWAYGGALYLDPSDNDQMSQIVQLISSFPSARLGSFTLNSTMEAYVYCRVMNETAEDVNLRIVVAMKLLALGGIDLTADLPKAGTYWILENAPSQSTRVSVNAKVDMMVFEQMDILMQRSDKAIKSFDSITKLDMSMMLKANNIPMDDKILGMNRTVEYANYDVALDMNMRMSSLTVFQPYLDIFDFPIELNETWFVPSTMTTTGNMTGTIVASGIPEGTLDDIVQANNLSSLQFPIDLSTFSGKIAGKIVNNGEIVSEQQSISAKMHCVSQSKVEHSGENITVYRINVNEDSQGDPEGVIYYSPDLAFPSSFDATTGVLGQIDISSITDIVPIGLDADKVMSLGYFEPSKAVQNIESISGEVVVRDEAGPEPTTEGNGLPVIFMIIMVGALLAVIAVAAVIMYRKKKAL